VPPEALAGLDASSGRHRELCGAADGSSTLTPLTLLPLATVTGNVRAHGSTTAVANATVTLANSDLFFDAASPSTPTAREHRSAGGPRR
jgi:hypothetical protein